MINFEIEESCENCVLYDRCFPIAEKNSKHGYTAFRDGKMLCLCDFEHNGKPKLFVSKNKYQLIEKNT